MITACRACAETQSTAKEPEVHVSRVRNRLVDTEGLPVSRMDTHLLVLPTQCSVMLCIYCLVIFYLATPPA